MRSTTARIVSLLLLSLALGGCNEDGDGGVCCEAASSPCSATGARGGWAANEAACADLTIDANDGHFELRTDERGCDYWWVGGFCSGDEDGVTTVCCGGAVPTDAGT